MPPTIEIEFHRRLRTQLPSAVDVGSLHKSYSCKCVYEHIVKDTGSVTVDEIEIIRERFTWSCDVGDVLAARDSLSHLLGLGMLDKTPGRLR
jgi:hypothetical protein